MKGLKIDERWVLIGCFKSDGGNQQSSSVQCRWGSEPYWGYWNVIIPVTFLTEYILSASTVFSLSVCLMSRYLLLPVWCTVLVPISICVLCFLLENNFLWRPRQGRRARLQRVHQVSEGAREKATAHLQELGQKQWRYDEIIYPTNC